MAKDNPDPRIDKYIPQLPIWQQAICIKVRRIVHAADAEVQETIKRTRQPYFTMDGNVCALLAAKDWVTVFLYDGGLARDPEKIITGGHQNTTGRFIQFRQDQEINEKALEDIFRQIIETNRQGRDMSI